MKGATEAAGMLKVSFEEPRTVPLRWGGDSAWVRRSIVMPQRTGKILRALREAKEWSLEEAERATNVRAKYLLALERDDYQNLPGPVYAGGFLSRYAELLGANTAEILAQYQGEHHSFGAGGWRVSSVQKPVLRLETKPFGNHLLLTPKILWGLLITAVVVALSVYIGLEVRNFMAPPALAITSPIAEARVATDHLAVTGRTNSAATLEINGQSIPLDANGQFSQDVRLSIGLNRIEIKARNRLHKETTKILGILRER